MTSSSSVSYNQSHSIHSFSLEVATALKSVDQAIFLHHIFYWLEYNERAGKNFQEGRYWSYQTLEELQYHFPYWTVRQLRFIIEKLMKAGILLKGNFNENKYDHTTWYSIDYEKYRSICQICQNGSTGMSDRTVRNVTSSIINIDKHNEKQLLQEEVVVVVEDEIDEQVQKMSSYLKRFSQVHGPEWDIPIAFLKKLISVNGFKYVTNQLNYMAEQQAESWKDEKAPYKKNKTSKIEKPKKYLERACKENWADSEHKKE
jgi:hypothetical protein